MEKRFLLNFLYGAISIFIIYGYVQATTEVLSNKYTTLSECTSDKDKYNIQFPDYVRSTCFAKDGGYYYTLCQKGETCNALVSTQNNQTTAIEYIGGENPYAKSINQSIKIDAIVSALENKKKQTSASEMEVYLNNFLSKLGTLRSKYAGKKAVEDILGYLEIEAKRMKEDTSLNTFMCDLTGDCDTATNTTTGNSNTSTKDVKECSFNLTPYYNLGLKTTFYYSDKKYEPNSSGIMTLPGNMKDDFYVFKGTPTNPQVYFTCNDGTLILKDTKYQIVNPLPGVIDNGNKTESSTINNLETPIVENVNIICAGNGWPASIDIKGNGNFNVFGVKSDNSNILLNLIRHPDTNNYLAQISSDVEKINISPINSTKIISSTEITKCTPNNFAQKPEIISANYNVENKTIVVKTKNALSIDYIDIFDGKANGGLFWEKDKNGVYTATLTDPYYIPLISFIKSGKSNVGIYGSFEPNYWRNSVRNITYPITLSDSDFSYIRSYDSKGQWLEWTTSSNVKNLARKSIGPNGIRFNDLGELIREKEFLSFHELKKHEWLSGAYDMTWTITLKDGTIKTYKEYFYIPEQ